MLDDGISRLAKQALPRKTSVKTRLVVSRVLILTFIAFVGCLKAAQGASF